MCGYCIESAYFLSFIYKNINVIDVTDSFLYPVYMEESETFIEDLENKRICSITFISQSDISETSIIYCRIIEKLILENKNFYHILDNRYYIDNTNKINTFIAKRYKCAYLNNFDLKRFCNNTKYREKFLKNKTKLIDISTKILKDYCKFWILGIGKEISDPIKRMSETGIMDPIENTTPENWEKFYLLFPIVFFAFLILEKYTKKSKIIKYIALNDPHDIPDFPGLDLWLQRRAFTKCIKEYGIQFFLKNYENIRQLELLFYFILKNVISKKDLLILKEHFLDYEKKYNKYYVYDINHNKYFVDNIDPELVKKIIDKKLKT